MAYGVQAPDSSRTDDEVHREPADHAEPREVTSDHHGGLGDRRGVLDVRGEHAAEVALAAGATEQLVVRGQQLDLPVGQGPHLDAGTGQGRAGDPLLDDAAVRGERRQVGVEGQVVGLQLHREHPGPDLLGLGGRPRRGEAVQVDHRVARAGDALVELHDRLGERRPAGAHAPDAGDDVVDAVEVLGAHRARHAELLEHPAAPGLAAQLGQAGIRAVHGDSQAERDVPLEGGRVVRDQVAALRVGDERPDLAEHPRPGEQLGAQGGGRTRRRSGPSSAAPGHGWG